MPPPFVLKRHLLILSLGANWYEQLDLLLLTVAKTHRVQQDGIRFQGYLCWLHRTSVLEIGDAYQHDLFVSHIIFAKKDALARKGES